MKKYLLSIIVTIALVATVLAPKNYAADDIDDNWSEMTASMYFTDSNKNDLGPDSWTDLDNGYFYCKFVLRPTSQKGITVLERINIGQYEGDLSNIANIEYQQENGQWADARSVYVNNAHTLTTSKNEYQIFVRMNFNSDITFTLQYTVTSEDGQKSSSTKQRYIRINNGQVIFTQKLNYITTPAPSTEETTPVESSTEETSVEPTAESTPAPTTTVEPTAEPSTEPSTEPSSVAPSTEPSTAPSTAPTTKPTTQPSTAPTTKPTTQPSTAPTTRPTTQPSTAPTTRPTTQPSIVPTTTPETTPDYTTYTAPAPSNTTVVPTGDVTTKGQVTKAPGKATIKKVWKKKKSAKKLKVKLKKAKGAKGYQISVYKSKKNAKKHIKAIVTKYTTKLKYTIKSKKLKKKKKLFVGARAYNLDAAGTKVFGPWAKIKKVKVK